MTARGRRGWLFQSGVGDEEMNTVNHGLSVFFLFLLLLSLPSPCISSEL